MMSHYRYIFAITTSILCWLFYSITGELYVFPDNFGVAIVLSGYFGSPLSQYQHPLFCLFINLLAQIVPSTDMFTLTIHVLFFIEIIILLLILTEQPFRKAIKDWHLQDCLTIMFSILFVFFLSTGLKIWRANYTIQAASFVFTGWMMLFYAKRERKNLRWIIGGTVFTAIGYMLRKEAGMLFVPFIVLMLVTEFLNAKDRKAELSLFRRYLLPSCLTVILLFASQTIYTTVEPNSTADRYNGARTAMVDFPIRQWDASFEGISKTDYNAVNSWILADTEIINTEYLEKMAATGARNEYELNIRGLRYALSDMWVKIWQYDVYISVMVMLCALMVIWNAITGKTIWNRLSSVLGLLGAFVILLYFTFRGRAIYNVWESALFALLTLQGIIMMDGKISNNKRMVACLLLSTCLYYSAGQVFAHAQFHAPQTVINTRIDVDDSAFEKTYQNDGLYIWTAWDPKSWPYFRSMGKLPTQQYQDHNIAFGDWTYGQPYCTAFFERIGHPNPIRDLIEKDNVYVMSNSAVVLNFLREHYGEDIDLVEAGEVNGVTAYRAVRE